MSREIIKQDFINELPIGLDLKSINHCKISIADVFPDKFCEITNSYVRKLQWVLTRYDVVIFMARKAICFYKALCLNEELTVPTSCEIYSSRILSYNVWEKLTNKKVALVDDVVIRGGSLDEAKRILKTHNISVDVFISALMYQEDQKSFSNDQRIRFSGLIQSIQQPFVYLNETDIYSYANYITRFIEASMLPYNIDQPTALVEYKKDQLNSFMSEHRLTDITSSVQKKFGIENRVIHYSGEILKPILGSVQINLDEVCIKLRIFHDIGSCQLLIFPIILFPVISKETVDHIYKHIQTPDLDELIFNENPQIEEENKIKILLYVLNHYILSRFLWCEREHGRNFVYCGFDSNESILFSRSIFEPGFAKTTLQEKISRLTMPYKWEQKTSVRPMFFNEYVGAAYAVIFSKTRGDKTTPTSSFFTNAKGEFIKRKIFTLQTLSERLKHYAYSKQYGSIGEEYDGVVDNVDLCIVSNIIDVLIDRGILVPEIVHSKDGGIIRAYRCGEVAKLNEIEFELFSYMLNYYSAHVWKNNRVITVGQNVEKAISKREAEQLCVLFFRKAAKSGLFEQINDGNDGQYEDDAYSIYYSLFGPTVSLQPDRRYDVNEKDTLLAELTAYGYLLAETDDNFSCGEADFSNLDNRWKRFAQNFANEMLFLKRIFPPSYVINEYLRSSDGNKSDNTPMQKQVFSKVHSFEELLTLMSIGENEMQRTLSIVAEIKIIADMKTEKLSSALSYFKNHMDCIWEGIWKSSCYVAPHLLDHIQGLLEQGKNFRDAAEISRLFQEYVDGSARVDRNEVISSFLRQCGEFFYRTYYTVCIINNNVNESVDLEAKCKIPYRFKYEKSYKDLWDSIAAKYRKCPRRDLSKMALNDLIGMQREAMAILDICDLYLKYTAFGYKPSKRSIIICADNQEIFKELQLVSRESTFNRTQNGKLDDNRFFRCFLLETGSTMGKKDLVDLLTNNLNELVSSTNDLGKVKCENARITVIYYSAQNWYEALFSSGDTCSGEFVKRFLKRLTAQERKWNRGSGIELFICGESDRIETEITSTLFKLVNQGRTINILGYPITNYGVQPMACKNGKGGVTIYADTVGTAIGSAPNSHVVGITPK